MASGLVEYMDFYHYTCKLGMEQIIACGFIIGGSFGHHGSDMAVVPFHHYTNHSGMEGITRCGYIRIGTFNHFERGVYGTTLGPNEGKITIARKNWAQGWKKRLEEGRVDYAILVYLPCDKVINCNAGRRNIYRYIGAENLVLRNYKWEIVRVP